MDDLLSFLSNDLDLFFQKNGKIKVKKDFVTPGYWVALVAYCRFNKIGFDQIHFVNNSAKRYASAIALNKALEGVDNYQYKRKNSGINYCELVHLENELETDRAAQTINSCIRDLFWDEDNGLSLFVKDLIAVVGDLHDNVWSHGKSSGFSMAQKWKKRGPKEGQFWFEFALADCGLGFLRELRSVGLDIDDDQQAIAWCIEEGNSSKKLSSKQDEWSQKLPADMQGNPIPGIGNVVVSENHHMGLGLAKLVALVYRYKGNLWLTSGKKTLIIEPNGRKVYKNNKQNWQGVAIACRFDTEKAQSYVTQVEDEDIASLIDLLGGRDE